MRSFSQRSCETDSKTTLGERPFQKTYTKNNVRINLDKGRLWGISPHIYYQENGTASFPLRLLNLYGTSIAPTFH